MSRKLLALTMGDPAGIGPEIIIKSLEKNQTNLENLLVIGDREVLAALIQKYDSELDINTVSENRLSNRKKYYLNLLDLENIKLKNFEPGRVQKNCGRAAVEYILKAIQLAQKGQIAGIVTCPIHKEALNLAGVSEAGHTEILANRFQVKDYAMMLVENNLRVSHVSTHVSLRKACELVKKERILQVLSLTDEFLKNLAYNSPPLAVAGLNPHAGEHGLFGSEEKKEILPAVKKAQKEGINAEGPFPPDTIFARARAGEFAAVVVMYHDQGHIPMKTIGFEYDEETNKSISVSGVNVTLGLPTIRTSVDHGVAFDIAWQNQARPESLLDALQLAEDLI